MEKTKKSLAWLLALSMALNGGAALAKKKEKATPTATPIPIEEEVTAISAEDLCLPEEFIAYANQNDIQIVDGNIIADTEEKLIKIREYFIKDLKSKGIEVDDTVKNKKVLSSADIMDYILNFNLSTINEDIKISLADEGLITMPVFTYDKIRGALKIIGLKLGDAALNCDENSFISNLPIIFDLKTRQCVKLAEDYLKTYILFNNKSNDSACYDGYIRGFADIYKFLNKKENNFPYSISDLDETAQHVFYIVIYEMQLANLSGGGSLYTQFAQYFGDDTYNEIYPSIAKYVDNFPYVDEKVAKKGK